MNTDTHEHKGIWCHNSAAFSTIDWNIYKKRMVRDHDDRCVVRAIISDLIAPSHEWGKSTDDSFYDSTKNDKDEWHHVTDKARVWRLQGRNQLGSTLLAKN
jgi:hypothetical protein